MHKRKPAWRDRAAVVEFGFVGLLTAFMLLSGLIGVFSLIFV
jgi:hypothetical protein